VHLSAVSIVCLVEILLLRSNSYADAKDWDDLVHTFTEWLEDSSLDEIILLLHSTIPGPQQRPPKHVRPVTYNRLGQVPRLLLSPPSALEAGVTPVYHHQQHIEAVTGVQPDSDHGGHGQHERIDMTEDRIPDGKETDVVISGGDHGEIDEARVDAAKVIQGAYRRHLERKLGPAARKIQRAYCRYLKRKRVVRTGIDAAQARYWNLLRKRSMEMEWTKGSQYYVLFRVPLAYILVCLEVIKAFVESEKKVAQKRMMTEDHKGLEESMEALNRYRYDNANFTLYQGSNKSPSDLRKKTIALQKLLSPPSKFHEKKSVSDLQDAVQEVKNVVESLGDTPRSVEMRDQIKKDWDRGWKWIFEKQGSKAKGKKAEKPKLVLRR